jgi:PIN domain nuclease of toxin-antitoxin system
VRVLLDTCALIWCALDETQLTGTAQTALESLDTEVFVSAASAWEIATKVRLGKLLGAVGLAAEIATVVRRLGFTELPVSLDHAQRAGLLPGSHKDPFDRLLIAQAQAENLPIVSSDTIFDDYRVRRIW